MEEPKVATVHITEVKMGLKNILTIHMKGKH